MKTFTADVLQYLLPDGRQKKINTELPAELESAYRDMLACGCRLEAEVLTTGEVSVTIFDLGTEDDRDISVTPNGPEVPAGMIAMLQREAWKTAATVLGED